MQIYVPFLCLISEQGCQLPDIFHHISLDTMNMQLPFLYFTHIQQLVHQIYNTVGILLHQAQHLHRFGIIVSFQQVLQRTHNQSHRRTDFMRKIYKELDFLLAHFFLMLTADSQINLECNGKQYQDITDICRHRTPPRSRNINLNHLDRSVLPVLTGTYLKCVSTGI